MGHFYTSHHTQENLKEMLWVYDSGRQELSMCEIFQAFCHIIFTNLREVLPPRNIQSA